MDQYWESSQTRWRTFRSTFQQYISIQTLGKGFRIGDLLFQNLRYADDTTLITETMDDQNEMSY